MTFISRVGLAAVMLAASCTAAAADTITAAGQGWCSSEFCNSASGVGLHNTFAGSHATAGTQAEYRNWFAFDIPGPGVIAAATLNVWNADANYTDADALFLLRDASMRTFDGLFGTTTLASIAVAAADTGTSHYVGLPINLAGLNLLNAARGSRFLFGGVVSPFLSTHEVQVFGYTQGPPAAFLELTRDPAPVPEPSTVVVVIGGALAFGSSARGRAGLLRRLRR